MGSAHLPAEIVARQAMMALARANSAVDAATANTTGASNSHPTSPLQQFGFAIIFFFPALALIVVGLRVYSRLTTKQFGMDDSLIVLSMVLSIAETAAMYKFMVTNYIGIHFADIPSDHDKVEPLVWNFVVQVLYNPILALVKTSVLVFLLKIGSNKLGLRWCIYVLNTLNLSLMVAIFVVVIFQCHPISSNWNTTIEGAGCIKQGAFYVATAALTIFTDILNLALPFWVFLDLKLPLRVKVALLFVFLLGGIVTIVGIVRLVFIYRSFFQPTGADSTYTLGFVTSAIETNLAIICASAPSLRGLIRTWFPHFFSSAHSYDHHYPNGNRGRSGYGGRGGNIYGNSSVATNVASQSENANASKGSGRRHHLESGSAGNSFALQKLKSTSSRTHTEVNSHSPSTSEEEIMTYNGIIRTTNVMVRYDNESVRMASKSRERCGTNSSTLGMRTNISGSL